MPRESAPHAMGPMHGSVAYPVVMMTMMLDSEQGLCVIAAVWAPSQGAGWSTHAWLSRQSHEDMYGAIIRPWRSEVHLSASLVISEELDRIGDLGDLDPRHFDGRSLFHIRRSIVNCGGAFVVGHCCCIICVLSRQRQPRWRSGWGLQNRHTSACHAS